MYGAGAGNGLQRNCTLLLDGGRVCAEDELLRGTGEFGKTGDGKVFVVQVGVVTEEFIGLETWWG